MKELFANKTKGFYLTLVAAVLSLAGIFVYTTVMYKFTPVFILLAAVVVVELILTVLLKSENVSIVVKLLPVINCALIASAVVWSFFVMVNQLGYVVAGLDPASTITSFIIFVVIGFVALILNIASCFMSMVKES